jgi:actin-related protein
LAVCRVVCFQVDPRDWYVGHEAQERSNILRLRTPIDGGEIDNWDDMEAIWQHILARELKVEPEEHPLIVTQRPYWSRRDR